MVGCTRYRWVQGTSGCFTLPTEQDLRVLPHPSTHQFPTHTHTMQNHNLYNYAYYYNRTKDPETARIAAIRIEYLEQDWIGVEERLLGTSPNFSEGFKRKNKSRKIDEDNYLSRESLKNICDALCEEIQVYKKLLKRAENLNDTEVRASAIEISAKYGPLSPSMCRYGLNLIVAPFPTHLHVQVGKSMGELYTKCPTQTSQWFCPERDEALVNAPAKNIKAPPLKSP